MKLYPLLIFIVIMFMSIGYAVVDTTDLFISGTSVAMMQEGIFMIDAVYLDSDGADINESKINSAEGTILNSTIKLSETDIKSYITYRITLYNNYDYDCFFENVVFDEKFYDNTNITFELNGNLLSGMKLSSKSYITFDLTFKYVDDAVLSKEGSLLNSYINFNFDSVAILKSTSSSDTSAFRSATYKEKIKNITFQNKIDVSSDAIESWDIGVSQTGDVIAYVIKNIENEQYYDLYIQSDTQLYANENMSYWFYNLKYVDSVNGIELMDTSLTTNMSSMFDCMGYESKILKLDVSSFDTGNVTTMNGMFRSTGYKSSVFTLDITGFDTKNVKDMSFMFHQTGCQSLELLLDVSGFITDNVTNMSGMFRYAGYQSKNFALDLKSFNTSNVTNMSGMFYSTGYRNTSFILDVSGFNTSKVTTMSDMFSSTGYNSTMLTLNVSGFDTSNVTNMNAMFAGAGYKSTVFELDVSGFDTSNVTNMGSMFLSVGKSNTSFELDVSNFNTSKVTNMQNMFRETGFSSELFTLDISNFDTSKVTNMSAMFYFTGYTNPNFTLKLGDFNTSSVTNYNSMFNSCGFNSTVFNTTITIRKLDSTYDGMFSNVALKSGSQIIVNYTSDTYDFVDLLIATKSETSNVVKGELVIDIGEEIKLGDEKFNVISYDKDFVLILAKTNLGTDYKQSSTANAVLFAEAGGWEFSPGPKEVDIQTWSSNVATYVNEYVSYLDEFVDGSVSGDLITLSQLSKLDCVIPDDYSWISTQTCANSKYKSWLVNGQYWWTKSAYPNNEKMVWMFYYNGYLTNADVSKSYAVRPVIKISIEDYMKL